jgi:hypothetical protein
MGQILYPPSIVEVSGSVIFLAGPIQGADQWQEKAIKIIQTLDSSPNIACPRRPLTIRKEFGSVEYGAQVDWETHYLRRAGDSGVVMFWLAKEFNHLCKRAYAQTSRFELGEWKVRHERDGSKLVVGIEQEFTNRRYIQRRFEQDCPEIKICSSLEETCKETLRIISGRISGNIRKY